MTVTPAIAAATLYIGIFALIGVWLGVIVSGVRSQEKIFIGDGGNENLIRAMRGQANFVESIPIILLMILSMALFATPAWVIHLLAIPLIFGRIMHGLHFSKPGQPSWQRASGAIITILVTVVAAIGVIGHAVYALM